SPRPDHRRAGQTTGRGVATLWRHHHGRGHRADGAGSGRVNRLPRNTILIGDAATRLRELPSGGVDTVVTSPPYFQLRDYNVRGQLGLEPHVDTWVDGLRSVF